MGVPRGRSGHVLLRADGGHARAEPADRCRQRGERAHRSEAASMPAPGRPISATSVPQVYLNSMRVTTPARFFVLDAEKFAEVMRDWFPMAVHLLEGLFFGIQNGQQVTQQRERLLALASLSAGLTHELNNPAAAAVRATSALRVRVAGMRHKLGFIAAGKYDPTGDRGHDPAPGGGRRARRQGADADPAWRPPTGRTSVGDWLDEHGISGEWELAPTFVQAGLDESFLDRDGRHRRRGRPRGRDPLAELHGRDRTADERDRRRHHADLRPRGRREAVLADGPRALPDRSTCTNCSTAR